MGEIAEMMLDGTMCGQCGEWLHGGGDGPGYPGLCYSCRREDERAPRFRKHPKNMAAPKWKEKVYEGDHKCDLCERAFKSRLAMMQHQQDKHQVA